MISSNKRLHTTITIIYRFFLIRHHIKEYRKDQAQSEQKKVKLRKLTCIIFSIYKLYICEIENKKIFDKKCLFKCLLHYHYTI